MAEEQPKTPVEQESGTVDDPRQRTLFEMGDWWEESWRGMPPFENRDAAPWLTVSVHLTCREDLEAFEEYMEQKVPQHTRSIWFPKRERAQFRALRWVDADRGEGE